MKPHRIIKNSTRYVGEPSSKYGYDRTGKQFERDMQARKERGEYLWSEFVSFMQAHDTTPDDFRSIFMRYYEEFVQEQ